MIKAAGLSTGCLWIGLLRPDHLRAYPLQEEKGGGVKGYSNTVKKSLDIGLTIPRGRGFLDWIKRGYAHSIY